MNLRRQRHYVLPTGPLSRSLLLLDLALALALMLARDPLARTALSAAAVPCSLATCALLRFRICGDMIKSLAWAFLPVAAGIAVWAATG